MEDDKKRRKKNKKKKNKQTNEPTETDKLDDKESTSDSQIGEKSDVKVSEIADAPNDDIGHITADGDGGLANGTEVVSLFGSPHVMSWVSIISSCWKCDFIKFFIYLLSNQLCLQINLAEVEKQNCLDREVRTWFCFLLLWVTFVCDFLYSTFLLKNCYHTGHSWRKS